MEFENIIYKVDGGIATIQLNRPKALNALNSDINHDIMEAIKLVPVSYTHLTLPTILRV